MDDEASRGERVAEEDEDTGKEGEPVPNEAGRAEVRRRAARVRVADTALADAIKRQRERDT